MKNFSIIAAVAENGAIGKNNEMLWHISADFKYFKETTLGHTVIMGKNTWLSLPKKPLPKRTNIIISRSLAVDIENVVVVSSIEKVIELCNSNDEHFVIGGGKIYEEFMPLAKRLYITRVNKSFDADTFFPNIDENVFKLISQSETFTDDNSGLQYCFEIYER